MALSIVDEFCLFCDICREVCPYAAVEIAPVNGVDRYIIVENKCTECGGLDSAPCHRYCPEPRAITNSH